MTIPANTSYPGTGYLTAPTFLTGVTGGGSQTDAQLIANSYDVKAQGGAVGDGITDDTTAIRNAMAAATSQGKALYFPAGTYLIHGSNVASGTAAYGSIVTTTHMVGAIGQWPIIRMIPGSSPYGGLGSGRNCIAAIRSSTTPIIVSGLYLDGGFPDSRKLAGNFGGTTAEINYAYDAGIQILDSSNITIRNCFIIGAYGDGVEIASVNEVGPGGSNIRIENNTVMWCTRMTQGMKCTGPSSGLGNIWINNVFSNLWGYCNCWDLEPNTTSELCYNIEVAYNRWDQYAHPFNGTWTVNLERSNASPGGNIRVHDNYVYASGGVTSPWYGGGYSGLTNISVQTTLGSMAGSDSHGPGGQAAGGGAGVATDPGWPVNASISAATRTNTVLSTPATGGAGRLIVVTVQIETAAGTAPQPLTVSGMGLTWAQVRGINGTTAAVNCDNEVWAAWAPSAVGASSITVTCTGSGASAAKSMNVTAYSYSGMPSGSSSVMNCFGAIASVSNLVASPPSVPLQTPISISSNSAVVVSMGEWKDGSGFIDLANTGLDFAQFDTVQGCSHASARLNISASGTITVGSTFGSGDGNGFIPKAIIAIEIPLASSPAVTNISPPSGPTAGGTAVTISGTNFTAGAAVTFGGVAATSVVVVNQNTITCVSPAGTDGVKTVLVTMGTQTASGTFTYHAPPQLTSLTPTKGNCDGGDVLTLNGSFFQNGAVAWLNKGGGGAVSFVNTVPGDTLQGAASFALPSFPVAAGNLVVIGIVSNSTISTVTDSAGNTYARVAQKLGQDWGSNEVWTTLATNGSPSNVVTVGLAGAAASVATVAQYSGIVSATPETTTFTNAAVASSMVSGSFSPAASGNLVVAFTAESTNPTTYFSGAGYTLRTLGTAWTSFEDLINAPSGAQTASIAWSRANSYVDQWVLTFRPSQNYQSVGTSFVSASQLTLLTPSSLPARTIPIHITNPDSQNSSELFTFSGVPSMPPPVLPQSYARRRIYLVDVQPIAQFTAAPATPPPNSIWGFHGPHAFARRAWNPPRDFHVAPVGFFVAGPPTEAGYPVSAKLITNNGTAQINVPPTLAGDRLIYLTVNWYSGSTGPGPVQVVGLGLNWQRITGTNGGAPFPQQQGSEVWAAWASQRNQGGLITVNFTNTGTTYCLLTAYARYGTAGLGVAANAFGNRTGLSDMTGRANSRNLSLGGFPFTFPFTLWSSPTGVTPGSGVLFSIVDQPVGASSPQWNTTADAVYAVPATLASASLIGQLSATSVSVGFTGTGTFTTSMIVEILAAVQASSLGWWFHGPESFARPRWNPERSMAAAPAFPIPNPPAPTMGFFHGPASALRRVWNPERSSYSASPLPLRVIVPASPIPPALPGRWARPAWNPERSFSVKPSPVSYLGAYGTVLAPNPVRCNQPFVVQLVLVNPLATTVYVEDVIPYLAGGPGAVSDAAPQGMVSTPTRLSAQLSNGLLVLRTNQPVTLTFNAVAFEPGAVRLGSYIEFDGGQETIAAEAFITVLPIGS